MQNLDYSRPHNLWFLACVPCDNSDNMQQVQADVLLKSKLSSGICQLQQPSKDGS